MAGRRSAVVLAVVFVTIGAVGTYAWLTIRRGFSTHGEPSAIERLVARQVRSLAVPSRAKALQNPVSLTDEVLSDARAHFADHCASCHANDGSGNTTIGRNLYPKAPDMRLEATQQLTDGELYHIIQNGVRLTGMPAWGKVDDDNDEDSWKLVFLIRRLKNLTPEQLQEMAAMNPKSPDEIEEERQEREFLNGGAEPPEDPKPSHGSHKHP